MRLRWTGIDNVTSTPFHSGCKPTFVRVKLTLIRLLVSDGVTLALEQWIRMDINTLLLNDKL